MATTKEMEKIWQISAKAITSYCAVGMIPSAEKIRGRWNIPSDAPKPPCTQYMAVRYLAMISAVSEGGEPDFTLLKKKETEIVDGMQYLSDIGFCTKIRWISDHGSIDFIKSLENVRVTRQADALIASITSQRISSSGQIKFGGGIIPAEITLKGEIE